MDLRVLELTGHRVRLKPLSLSYLHELSNIAFDDELWRHTTSFIRSESDLTAYIKTAIEGQKRGYAVPFVTTLADSTVVGCTRFGNIDVPNRRVEIGWTWVGRRWQRTFVNTEAKYLMLRHAFEVWDCVRVEFKTGTNNERSRRALLRLGAREEGTLRRHMKLPDGSYRDTVYYSILLDEWPEVNPHLG